MQKNITCLIFDFDGVIADTDLARYYILKDILEEYGIDFEEQFSMKDLIGLSTESFLKKNFETLSAEQVDEIVNKKHQLHFNHLDKYVIPFPHADETLRYFHNRFELAMVSANPQKNLEILLNHLDIKHFFKWIMGREVCENNNLEKTYYPVASKIQRDVSECIVIEDSEYGVNAARKAGYYCIRFDPYNRFASGLENDRVKNHPDLIKKIEQYTEN